MLTETKLLMRPRFGASPKSKLKLADADWSPNVIGACKTADGRSLTISELVAVVAAKHGVHAGDIMSKSRRREIAYARFEVWWTLRQRGGVWSYPNIARHWGYDHTSILFGVRKWSQILAERAGQTAVAR